MTHEDSRAPRRTSLRFLGSEGLRRTLHGASRRLSEHIHAETLRRHHTDHSELSLIYSSPPADVDEELLRIALEAVAAARLEFLTDLATRCDYEDRNRILSWPGEHYRLLPGLVRASRSRHVVEIGTYEGHGALALAGPAESTVTFDIVPWPSFPNSVLRPSDFSPDFRQVLGDLSDPRVFDEHQAELATANLIFIDGPKDGVFEQRFWNLLTGAFRGSGKFVVWDDTRVLNMVKFWASLRGAKLDLTSFGHWSGTGICRL